jgi:hypothetical protein
MKRLVLVAALAGALAACGEAAEEADDTATEEAAAPAEETAGYAGTYEVTMADGMKFTSVLNADGTYTDTDADGTVTESGTWDENDAGAACFDSEGGDDTVICFTVGETAADGTQVATPDDGSDPLTIKKTS